MVVVTSIYPAARVSTTAVLDRIDQLTLNSAHILVAAASLQYTKLSLAVDSSPSSFE